LPKIAFGSALLTLSAAASVLTHVRIRWRHSGNSLDTTFYSNSIEQRFTSTFQTRGLGFWQAPTAADLARLHCSISGRQSQADNLRQTMFRPQMGQPSGMIRLPVARRITK
jgi:hypothetical protein